jgi:hypothetical protein
MKPSGNHSDEQGQSNEHRFRRRLRKRWVMRAVFALAPLATKVVELVIIIIRTLK